MRDAAHYASVWLYQALFSFFGERLPLGLGRELYNHICKRLLRAGIHDGDHAEEIFSRLIASAFKFLNRNGGSAVRHVRGWFYQIANHVTGQYLKEIHKYDSEALEEILRGNRSLPDVHIQNEELLWTLCVRRLTV